MNIVELYRSVVAGLAEAVADEPDIASIGVDSWAVDYALMRRGRLLQLPYHYRDARNSAAVDTAHAAVSPAELYRANGLQFSRSTPCTSSPQTRSPQHSISRTSSCSFPTCSPTG